MQHSTWKELARTGKAQVKHGRNSKAVGRPAGKEQVRTEKELGGTG